MSEGGRDAQNLERGVGGLVLVDGVHAPQSEIDYVYQVLKTDIVPQYKGPIDLIGSRALGRWISLPRFVQATAGMTDKDRVFWFNFLNSAAVEGNIERGQIPNLIQILPKDAPRHVRDFLNQVYGLPGSDIDVLLSREQRRVRQVFSDWDTGQVLDVFSLATYTG